MQNGDEQNNIKPKNKKRTLTFKIQETKSSDIRNKLIKVVHPSANNFNLNNINSGFSHQ